MVTLAELHAREEARFAETHPRSRKLAEEAHATLLDGVPMHWMRKWPGGFPVFVREAKGARFVDADGIEYVDFCPGDTGAMTGHAPEPTLRAIAERAAKGITLDGLERELALGDVAVVLTEPALTNVGIVHPESGFHEALRALTRKHGAQTDGGAVAQAGTATAQPSERAARVRSPSAATSTESSDSTRS